MITYNCGVVRKIGNREYELMSHNWHNPNYNIIATNVRLEGDKTLHICYNKGLNGDESITMFWYKGAELGHYLSKHYTKFKDIPGKYESVLQDLVEAYGLVNFDSLQRPSSRGVTFTKEDNADLVIKISSFKMDRNVLYCDILLRGKFRSSFYKDVKVSAMNRDMVLETTDKDSKILKVNKVEFADIAENVKRLMRKHSKVKLVSGVNLESIDDYKSKMLVIKTFNSVNNNSSY